MWFMFRYFDENEYIKGRGFKPGDRLPFTILNSVLPGHKPEFKW